MPHFYFADKVDSMNGFFAYSRMIPLAALFTGALLVGCSPVGRGLQRVGSNIHEQTVDYDRRIRGWLDSENELAEKERPPAPHTGYCYRTLGEVSCYPHRMAGQDGRLVGLQVPDPMFDELNYPIPEERPEAVYIDVAKERHAPEAVTAPPPEVTVTPAPPLITPQTVVEPATKPQPATSQETTGNPPRELMPAFNSPTAD